MPLIRLALGNPYLVVVAMIGVGLFGVLNLVRLPVDIFPDLKQPCVVLIYSYRGMPARDMERNVTTRIERMLTQASYLDRIESRSATGLSVVKVFFRPEADPNAAASQVANIAASIQRRMPPGMLPPYVLTIDPANVPVCQVVVSSETLTDAQLVDLARVIIRPQLGTVPGAAVGQAFGGKERRIMVYLDRDTLHSKGLSPMDVVAAIDVGNVVIPAGDAQIGDKDLQISSNALLPAAEAFGDIPIKVVDGKPVYIRDVATAEDAAAIQTNVVRVNGRRQIYIPIMRQAGSNAIAVVDGVRAALDTMKGLPDGVRMDLAFDQSKVIRDSVSGLAFEGLFGGGLACLMVLVFLASFRSTLVIGLSIPVSVLAAFVGLALTGQTINTMTLGGLALSVGTLIDNSIVVLENVSRHLGMGKSPRDAARDGAAEVARPVFIATLVNLAVYLPVMFMAGVGKFLFTPLALSVFFAMSASLVASLTVVPAYCARFLQAADHGHAGHRTLSQRLAHLSEYAVDRLADVYAGGLNRLLGVRLLFTATCAALFVTSALLYPLIGREFFPRVDSGQFVLHLRAPAGTRLDKTEELVAAVEGRIRHVIGDDVQVIVSNIGLTGDQSAVSKPNPGPHGAYVQVQLKPESHTPTAEYVEKLRADLATNVPEVTRFFETGGIVSAVLNNGLRAAIDVQVAGTRLPEIDGVAQQVRAALADVPGVAEVAVVQNLEAPGIRVEVDRGKAAETGLTADDLLKNLVTAVNSSINFARTLWIDPRTGDGYYVAVQYREQNIEGFEDLKRIPVTPARRGERPILLENLADIRREAGTTEVTHYNIQRIYNIHLEVQGRDVGGVADDVQARLDKLVAGMTAKQRKENTIVLRGEAASMNESFGSLGFGLVLAVAVVYLIVVPQFRSFLDPFLVLFAIPMGLAGVIWTLHLSDTTLNIQSYIGTIMMIGICAANSIMLVDFANNLRSAGLDVRAAAVEAGRVRLRPILMTALAASLGLAPMAVGGKGHEANAPLARAVIGGLLCSTVFTLFLVPVLYTLFKRGPAPRPADGPGPVATADS